MGGKGYYFIFTVDFKDNLLNKNLMKANNEKYCRKAAPASENKISANEKSAQQPSNSSKINVSKSVQPEPSKMEKMSTSKKGKQKSRKIIVIEEVDAKGMGVSFIKVFYIVANHVQNVRSSPSFGHGWLSE